MRNPQVGKRGESPIVPAYLDEVHNFGGITYTARGAQIAPTPLFLIFFGFYG